MTKFKVYTLGIHGLVGDAVLEALDQPRHRPQARVLIAAPTKAEAIRMLEERRHRANLDAGAYTAVPTMSDREFRQATGNDVDALRAAGLLNAPTVLVLASRFSNPTPVVRVDVDGVHRVGTLEADRLVANVTKEG